jgi:hypothetical protein
MSLLHKVHDPKTRGRSLKLRHGVLSFGVNMAQPDHSKQGLLRRVEELTKTQGSTFTKEELLEVAAVMAKEMAKEIVANMPQPQVLQVQRTEDIQQHTSGFVDIDDSIVDVTKATEFEKNFDSIGEEKLSDTDVEDKQAKLKELLGK